MVGLSVSMVGFSTNEPKINTKGTSIEITMIENVGRDKNNKQINKQFILHYVFQKQIVDIKQLHFSTLIFSKNSKNIML